MDGITRAAVRDALRTEGPMDVDALAYALGAGGRRAAKAYLKKVLWQMVYVGQISKDGDVFAFRAYPYSPPGSGRVPREVREGRVRGYLEAHGPSTMMEIGEALGMSRDQVRRALTVLRAEHDGGAPKRWRLVRWTGSRGSRYPSAGRSSSKSSQGGHGRAYPWRARRSTGSSTS